MKPAQSLRPIVQRLRGLETADGAGVRLTRLIGTSALPQLDPFLLLDDFRSDDPEDYIGGFPPHPHRGFETVTYLLAGRMRHADSAGHAGVIESGGVQWMTAGHGIIHSEMPEQEDGLLAGLQLWVNLPARHKLMAPRYQEHPIGAIPLEERGEGVRLRVIAGRTSLGTQGVVTELITPVLYYDIELAAGARLREPLPSGWSTLLYLVEGTLQVGDQELQRGELVRLGSEGELQLDALRGSRVILLAGAPIGEPIARHGPFVMNSDAEIRQAFRDYQAGRFTEREVSV